MSVSTCICFPMLSSLIKPALRFCLSTKAFSNKALQTTLLVLSPLCTPHRQLQAEAAERKSKFLGLQRNFKKNEDTLKEQVELAQAGFVNR